MIISQVVNTVFNSCSYVISRGDASWMVDCGDVDRIVPLLHGRLQGVLLTHAHFDHIYGLNHLIAMFPDVPVFTNRDGREGLLSDKLNFSRYHEKPFILNSPDNIRLVEDGQSFDLFENYSVKAIYTPGHSPGCVTWVTGDAIFTGDSYIPGVKTVTIFPHSDKEMAASSEDLIRSMVNGRQVYPGHPSQLQ